MGLLHIALAESAAAFFKIKRIIKQFKKACATAPCVFASAAGFEQFPPICYNRVTICNGGKFDAQTSAQKPSARLLCRGGGAVSGKSGPNVDPCGVFADAVPL